MYWSEEEQTWSTAGCTYKGTQNGRAICHCDHLTMFGLDSAPEEAEKTWTDSNIRHATNFAAFGDLNEQNLRGLVLVSFFYAIFIGILIILAFRDKADLE